MQGPFPVLRGSAACTTIIFFPARGPSAQGVYSSGSLCSALKGCPAATAGRRQIGFKSCQRMEKAAEARKPPVSPWAVPEESLDRFAGEKEKAIREKVRGAGGDRFLPGQAQRVPGVPVEALLSRPEQRPHYAGCVAVSFRLPAISATVRGFGGRPLQRAIRPAMCRAGVFPLPRECAGRRRKGWL